MIISPFLCHGDFPGVDGSETAHFDELFMFCRNFSYPAGTGCLAGQSKTSYLECVPSYLCTVLRYRP